MKLPKIVPDQPIEKDKGLMEAIIDVIIEETNGEVFRGKWMQQRLPYGSRVRKALCRLVRIGTIERVKIGYYRLIP